MGWERLQTPFVLVLVVVLVLEGGRIWTSLLRHSAFKFFFTQPPSPLMLFAVKLEVVVMPKRNVLDPQGVAVRNAVRELGLSNVGTVRVGKIIEIEFTGEPDEAKLDEICRDLLSNQVIEDYRILGAVLK